MIRLLVLLAALVLTSLTCSAQTIRAECPKETSPDHYFPANTFFHEDQFEDKLTSQFYSILFSAMEEPSLTCGKQVSSFRFLWHRSFDSSLAVRIILANDKATLSATELEFGKPFEPESIKRRKKYTLDPDMLKEITDAFRRNEFWAITNDINEARKDRETLDGSMWLIEAIEAAGYNAISRSNPKDGPIRELGLLFLKLSGWEFKENEIY